MPTGTVTFLFTDIVTSVGLWEQAPGAMREALERHDVILRETIASHAGFIYSTGGDAFQAVFGVVAIDVRRLLRADATGPTRIVATVT